MTSLHNRHPCTHKSGSGVLHLPSGGLGHFRYKATVDVACLTFLTLQGGRTCVELQVSRHLIRSRKSTDPGDSHESDLFGDHDRSELAPDSQTYGHPVLHARLLFLVGPVERDEQAREQTGAHPRLAGVLLPPVQLGQAGSQRVRHSEPGLHQAMQRSQSVIQVPVLGRLTDIHQPLGETCRRVGGLFLTSLPAVAADRDQRFDQPGPVLGDWDAVPGDAAGHPALAAVAAEDVEVSECTKYDQTWSFNEHQL